MTIPTIQELFSDIKADLETRLEITIPVFGKVFLNALAAAQAAKLKLFWLAIARVQKNIFVDTADPEAIGGTLERFGRAKLGRSPFAATQGQYVVQFTGTIGAVIEAGQIFKSDDASASPGKLFILDTQVTFAAATEDITLRALEAGTGARLEVGNTLTSTSPLTNIGDQGAVITESAVPLAAEELEAYRELALRAFQLESQGGAATDYRLWASDAQGVRFVYPYVKSGECAEIEIYMEANQADSADGKGTPTAQITQDVEDVIEFDPDTTRPLTERGRRPLGVFQIDFLPITPKDVDIVVNNSQNIDVETQQAIATALTQEIDNIRPFIDSADILENKNDILDVNKIIAIIQNLLSGDQQFDSIDLTVDAVPVTTSITFIDGDIPFFNSISYP